MNLKKMNLAKKILATTLVPFIIFAVVVQVTTNYFTKTNFEKVLAQFSTSMNEMKDQTTADFIKISEQLARDLIKEMKIGAGDSLQPGESIKFQHLADKQTLETILRDYGLENFDEEVHEKLRINLKESREYLSKYENWLWQVTKYYLDPYADFSGDGYSFMLRENPFSSEPIHPGPYRIGKNIEDANIYRIGHPLAQRVIEKCKSLPQDSNELIFDYSNTTKRISILQPLIGKAGWLRAVNLTVNSFESEDHILFCGITDNGLELDAEQCQRLFSLSAAVTPLLDKEGLGVVEKQLEQIAFQQQAEILQINAERNGGFFDTEMEKLDKWADDVKSSIEIELKELDREIKAGKTEAKKILNLEEKVKAQRQIKEMEKKRNELRQNLYQAQDEVDVRKENLINEIESRMKQKTETNELFTIKWKVV